MNVCQQWSGRIDENLSTAQLKGASARVHRKCEKPNWCVEMWSSVAKLCWCELIQLTVFGVRTEFAIICFAATNKSRLNFHINWISEQFLISLRRKGFVLFVSIHWLCVTAWGIRRRFLDCNCNWIDSAKKSQSHASQSRFTHWSGSGSLAIK